jgi:hypothetical protein
MVSLSRFAALASSALAVAVSCQAVLGIEDKELDPNLGSGGTGGAPDAQSGPTGADAVPPGRPPGDPVPGGGATRWFAARTIFIGTHDPESRKADKTAWRRIGHDIDGECTTLEISKSNSSATCKQPSAASVDSLEDGDDCRDNAAGRLVAVGTQVVSINFEPELHAGLLTAETPTYILRLDDLSGDADDPYVRGALYVSVPRNPAFEKAPSWDGADQFTIDQASTDAPASADAGDAGTADAGPKDGGGDAAPPSPLVDKPLFVFDKGYLSKNVWVSGDLGKSPEKVPLFVFDRLTVVDTLTTTLAVQLTAKHDQVVSSQLSAAVATSEIEKYFRPIALELVGCVPALGGLLMDSYVLPARDLGGGPTMITPGKPCDAQSFAFAFEWKPVKPPVSVLPGPTKPPKC